MDIAAVIDNQLFVHTYQILCELEKLHSFTMQNEHYFTLQYDTNSLDKTALIYTPEAVEEMFVACCNCASPIESSDMH